MTIYLFLSHLLIVTIRCCVTLRHSLVTVLALITHPAYVVVYIYPCCCVIPILLRYVIIVRLA